VDRRIARHALTTGLVFAAVAAAVFALSFLVAILYIAQ
jgi:hypothetical protein